MKLCRGAAGSFPTGPIRFLQVPFQYPRSRTATLEPGRVLPYTQPLRRPDCTLSRLFASVAEEHDRPVTQSTVTPEPSCPGPALHQTGACWGLECVTTLGSRRSCPGWAAAQHLDVDRFHQPCLLPWRTPYCHRKTAGLGRDRWGLSSPYHVATTYPCGQPGSPSLCDSLEVLPRRLDGTTAGC